MASIVRCASAGTLESSDVYVEAEPGTGGIEIRLQSIVMEQFGDSIIASAKEILRQYGVENGILSLTDRGALDCVIRARVETAILRGRGD